MIRTVLLSVTAAAVLVTLPGVADACSCLPPDIARSYNDATDVVEARIVRVVRRAPDMRVRYVARVHDTFKGCTRAGQMVILETASSSAACGVHLERGATYLLNGTRAPTHMSHRLVLSINSCDYNRVFSDLTDSDLKFLYSRYNCCGGVCACTDGSDPVHCFVDPCQVSTCDVDGARCVANYCGGCNAEWYDPMGAPVCLGDAACQTDEDCAPDAWCRPDQGGTGECVPFAGPGDTCEGFVLPWTRQRCEPDLVCVPREPTGDVPGICAACEYGGQPYQAGESFPADDGCNTCTCTEGGLIACTERACLPLECTREACGPRPLAPNYLCPDGETVAGPGDCVRGDDGRCGWEMITCPDEPVQCGSAVCAPGMVCCNASCGICTPPDGFCTQQACTPIR